MNIDDLARNRVDEVDILSRSKIFDAVGVLVLRLVGGAVSLLETDLKGVTCWLFTSRRFASTIT